MLTNLISNNSSLISSFGIWFIFFFLDFMFFFGELSSNCSGWLLLALLLQLFWKSDSLFSDDNSLSISDTEILNKFKVDVTNDNFNNIEKIKNNVFNPIILTKEDGLKIVIECPGKGQWMSISFQDTSLYDEFNEEIDQIKNKTLEEDNDTTGL